MLALFSHCRFGVAGLGVKVEVESMCCNIQRLASNKLFKITFSGAHPPCLHTGGALAPVAPHPPGFHTYDSSTHYIARF